MTGVHDAFILGDWLSSAEPRHADVLSLHLQVS